MEEAKQKQTENRLLRDYQTTITILEHLSDAIFILTPNGNIQYANRVATDLLGQNLEDLLGRSLNEFLSTPYNFSGQEKSNEEKSFLQQIYLNGLTEMESALKSGGFQIPVIISFGMVRNRQDEVQYIIASAKDVTWRRQLEKKLMQQQLLDQSKDRYRELGELAINIVHRLSQPITSIQLLVEMMQKGLQKNSVDAEQWMRQFGQIKELLNGMSQVINNVRNFAFLTEEESLQPVQLPQILDNALEQLHYELTEASATIDVQADEPLPGVLANALQLQQVIMTLLRFILDAPKRKPFTIHIRVRNAQNRWIEIVLGDASTATDVHFNQSEKQSTMLFEQNFNLTVVQLIVASLGGDIFHTADEEGHVFVLRLPADQADERQLLLNLIDLMNHK
jgi:PAS domain S-box-containing protein